MAERLVYFDNNATTPVAPEVLEAMLPFFVDQWGNPSSAYRVGQMLSNPLRHARAQIASFLSVKPQEIVFTSCGTESINSVLHSALLTQPGKRHILTTAVEHSATLNYGKALQQQGYAVEFLPVDSNGALDLEQLERSIRPDTALVSVMLANNETGIVFPIAEIARICRRKGVLLHTDAVQAAGKLKLDVQELGVDFLSLSGHKLRAPKGIGVLYVREGVKFQPYVIGGGQERGRRGGTENVPYIIGFGRAAELAQSALSDQPRVRRMRDRLESTLLKSIPNCFRNGPAEPRLPNTTNMAFEGVEAEALMLQLDRVGICVSVGSACTTGSPAPSHVLTAMGISRARALGSIRISLGVQNTEAEVDYLLQELPPLVSKLRAASVS